MKRTARVLRWLMVVGAACVFPQFIMRCDKAALNFQRGLFQALGQDVGSLLVDQIQIDGG